MILNQFQKKNLFSIKVHNLLFIDLKKIYIKKYLIMITKKKQNYIIILSN